LWRFLLRLCSSSFALDLSNVVYRKAKNAPTTRPGIEVISIELWRTDSVSKIAKPAEANDAIISIKIEDFVTANSPDLAGDSISGFLSYWDNRCALK
jgi:hypothetical protein